ncbi:MAG: YSC84-related protein [Rhodospirillaceae bacterium]|jgi:lipid-binding SYLF domain-containing protein
MMYLRTVFLALALAFGFVAAAAPPVQAASAANIDKDADQALSTLTKNHEIASAIAAKARAVLIFPNIVKAGLGFGGSYGEGVLRQGGKSVAYYNSVSGSFGLQIGAQTYGYVVFLMNDSAVKFLRESKGWEIGVGPTVVVVNEGVAKNLSSTTLQDDAYAFIFGQQGLMAGVSIEGSKVSKIDR